MEKTENTEKTESHKATKKSLTLSKKVELINAVESGQHSKSFIAREFGVAKSTVSDVLKKKDRIVEAYEVSCFGTERKRLRTSSYADVEESLLRWLKQARTGGVAITGPVLQSKGRELAILLGHPDFVCSKGWLHRFKSRNGIVFRHRQCNGESVSNSSGDDWLSGRLPRLLIEYSPQNVFSAGEAGFFWKALPESVSRITGGDGIEAMERFTILVCTSMTGEEKLPLLVVGRRSNPASFTNIRTLPVLYEVSERALMVRDIFISWLLLIDKKFQQEGRKIAMVIDGAPCHLQLQSQLEAVKLVFLPPSPGEPSKLHPVNRDVVQNLKMNYRKYLLIKLLTIMEAREEFSLDLLDALHLLHLSWVNVSQSSIRSSFSQCGFKEIDSPLATDDSSMTETNPVELAAGDTLIDQLRATGSSFPESLSFEQYINVDKDVATTAGLSDTAGEVSHLQALQTPAKHTHSTLPVTPPSAREADNAVVVLRRYFEAHNGMEQALNLVAEMEKRVLDCYAAQQKLT